MRVRSERRRQRPADPASSFFEVASEFPAIANSLRVQLGNVGSARIKKASTTMRMVISGDYHPCALKQREIPSITGSPEGSEVAEGRGDLSCS